MTLLIAGVVAVRALRHALREEEPRMSRQESLRRAIAVEQNRFTAQTGQIGIPVTAENVNLMMRNTGARENERSFVVGEMQTWLLQPPPDSILLPTREPGPDCSHCIPNWRTCNVACRGLPNLDDADLARAV